MSEKEESILAAAREAAALQWLLTDEHELRRRERDPEVRKSRIIEARIKETRRRRWERKNGLT